MRIYGRYGVGFLLVDDCVIGGYHSNLRCWLNRDVVFSMLQMLLLLLLLLAFEYEVLVSNTLYIFPQVKEDNQEIARMENR